jgi:hypothetical protein
VRERSLTAMSNDLHTDYSGSLYALAAYGSEYLTKQEFQMCWNENISQYYKFLGKSVLKGRDKKFWEYHQNKLKELGGGYSRIRLIAAVAEALASAAFSPKESFARIFKSKKKWQDQQPTTHGNPPRLPVKETH